MDTLPGSPRDSLLTTSPVKPTHSQQHTHMHAHTYSVSTRTQKPVQKCLQLHTDVQMHAAVYSDENTPACRCVCTYTEAQGSQEVPYLDEMSHRDLITTV